MASVHLYKKQPGLPHGGGIPESGLPYPYRVTGLLWSRAVEQFVATLLQGTSLHVCCGHSRLGDVRLDIDPDVAPSVVADASKLPFNDNSFDTVLCDPPYQGGHQWNHDVLSELSRVAAKRIVFQHWFVPATTKGRYRKAQEKFQITDVYVVLPRTYFGRAQLVSVFDLALDVTPAPEELAS